MVSDQQPGSTDEGKSPMRSFSVTTSATMESSKFAVALLVVLRALLHHYPAHAQI